jgi:hypothetical protein
LSPSSHLFRKTRSLDFSRTEPSKSSTDRSPPNMEESPPSRIAPGEASLSKKGHPFSHEKGRPSAPGSRPDAPGALPDPSFQPKLQAPRRRRSPGSPDRGSLRSRALPTRERLRSRSKPSPLDPDASGLSPFPLCGCQRPIRSPRGGISPPPSEAPTENPVGSPWKSRRIPDESESRLRGLRDSSFQRSRKTRLEREVRSRAPGPRPSKRRPNLPI